MTEPIPQKPKKLLDQLRNAIRIKHYSYSTEKSHAHYAKRNSRIRGANPRIAHCSAVMDVLTLQPCHQRGLRKALSVFFTC